MKDYIKNLRFDFDSNFIYKISYKNIEIIDNFKNIDLTPLENALDKFIEGVRYLPSFFDLLIESYIEKDEYNNNFKINDEYIYFIKIDDDLYFRNDDIKLFDEMIKRIQK